MKIKNKVMSCRVIVALMLTMLLLPVMALPAMASSYNTQEAWVELAAKMQPYKSIEDMGRRISSLAGNAQTINQDGGGKQPTVIVEAGTKYYVSGREVPAPDYLATAYDATGFNAGSYPLTDGGTGSVVVRVHKDHTSRELQSVNSSISAGLLSAAGVQPDTGTAMGLLSGIMPLINTFLGLIVTVISIGMTVFSALDIIYLAFPAFREKIDGQVESGGKGTKTKKDGSTGSRWVSDDAMQAVKETQEAQQQPWGAYFKKRVIAYVFLAVILFILLTGNIFAITTLVTNALSGLFETLGLQ